MQTPETSESPDADASGKPNRGNLFIISGPSGVGKTTLCRALRNRFTDMRYSISFTTRPARANERDGFDYHFISRSEFEKKIQSDEWAEWAEVHGNFYGTSAAFLKDTLNAGHDVLLDIDVQGTEQILKKFPHAVTIFILPPSWKVLQDRLISRGTEIGPEIEHRLSDGQRDMQKLDLYRHQIVNDRLSASVETLVAVFDSYRPHT